MTFRFKSGEHALRNLHGLFCVYKPEGMKLPELVVTLKTKILDELNALPNYQFEMLQKRQQPRLRELAAGKDDGSSYLVGSSNSKQSLTQLNSSLSTETPESNLPSQTSSGLLAFSSQNELSEQKIMNNRLVLGDRYEPQDLQLFANTGLAKYSSGIVVMGSGNFKYRTKKLNSRYTQVYHVKGRLGWASDSYDIRGRIVERSTFNHVNKSLVEKVCATLEANHQRKMFEYSGVNPESQEAYELATQGLLRPDKDHKEPIIYSIKCVAFDLPHFTVEVHAINEKCQYLSEVIHNFGLLMNTTAVCAGIRRIRSGVYDLNYALLYQDWKLPEITKNIKRCKLNRPPPPYKSKLSPTLGFLSKHNIGVFKNQKHKPDTPKVDMTESLKAQQKPEEKKEIDEKKEIEKQVKMLLSTKLKEEDTEEMNGKNEK